MGVWAAVRAAKITNSHALRPLAPLWRAFVGGVVCLYPWIKTAPTEALRASERHGMKKPAYTGPVFVFVGLLAARGPVF